MKNNQRGALVAVVAMVAVLVLGFVGYNVLAGTQTTTGATSSSAESLGDKTVDEASGEASAKDTGKDATQSGSDSNVPMLADYDATVYTDANEAMTLTQIADGKPLVMNFWATWCPYCVQEMPDFKQLYEEYGDRVSFAFIDATDGSRETLDAAKSWLVDNGLTDLPAYYDLNLDASAKFAARALPTTVVVSGDGQILNVMAGRINPDDMRAMLDSLV